MLFRSLERGAVHEFSVKYESLTGNAWMLIGIAPNNYRNEKMYFNAKEKWKGSFFYGLNGYCFKDGTYKNMGPTGQSGDILTLRANMSTGTMTVFKNGSVIHQDTLESPYMDIFEYYPCIELYYSDDQATFIDYKFK